MLLKYRFSIPISYVVMGDLDKIEAKKERKNP